MLFRSNAIVSIAPVTGHPTTTRAEITYTKAAESNPAPLMPLADPKTLEARPAQRPPTPRERADAVYPDQANFLRALALGSILSLGLWLLIATAALTVYKLTS